MSDKNSESFEEWLDEHFLNSPQLFQYGKHWIGVEAVKEKLQAAEEENKILREAVEFYADEENWDCENNSYGKNLYVCDIGETGRQALEKVRKE